MNIKSIVVEAGALIIQTDSGPPTRYPIADVIRVADVPVGLTHTQVAGVTYLANLIVILIRTLIERNVLDESFIDSLGLNWDLDHIIYAVEQLGGAYHEPELDDVEGA